MILSDAACDLESSMMEQINLGLISMEFIQESRPRYDAASDLRLFSYSVCSLHRKNGVKNHSPPCSFLLPEHKEGKKSKAGFFISAKESCLR